MTPTDRKEQAREVLGQTINHLMAVFGAVGLDVSCRAMAQEEVRKSINLHAAACVVEQLKIVATWARGRASKVGGRHRADLIDLAEHIEERACGFDNIDTTRVAEALAKTVKLGDCPDIVAAFVSACTCGGNTFQHRCSACVALRAIQGMEIVKP